ncbi:MAG: protein-export chaperone SecB [Desulfuromonadaceae bacterium]|nr:protein-export chaperone SecB [Desulfuromonadaceae bacterium]
MEKLHLTLIDGPKLVVCNFNLNEAKLRPKKKSIVKCQFAIEVNVDEEKKEVTASLSAKSDSDGLPFGFDIKSEASFKCEASCPSEKHIVMEAIPYIYPFVKELVADLTRKSYHSPFYLPPIEIKPESFEEIDE